MYGHAQPLNMVCQISPGESDDGSGAEAAMDGHHRIQYETHNLEGGSGGVVQDVTSDVVYGHGGGGSELALQRCDDSSQLTLSFRGQVYVFDSVTPEKVRFSLTYSGILFNY